MKYLRLTGRPDLEAAPAALALLVGSPHVERAQLLSWNVGDGRGVTGLFAVDGDRGTVEATLADLEEVAAVDTAPASAGQFYLLVTLRLSADPVLQVAFDAITSDGLVVVKPVVYRDGAVYGRVVGEPAAVQAALERLPPLVEVEVHEVGERGLAHRTTGAGLSDRQREAVLAALDLGYYDRPRRATHEDVADELECAPSTASEHLQKAEAKLVRAAMGDGRP